MHLLRIASLLAYASAGPCDIFEAAGTPCVAAHSTTRALYKAYAGPLYQVARASDGEVADVPVVGAGGVANSAAQDAFCGATACVISRIYDQTPLGNHLDVAPQHVGRNGTDMPVNATKDRLHVGGAPVYSAYFEPGMGYRNDATNGVPVGDEAQTIYMVTSGVHYHAKCCFD